MAFGPVNLSNREEGRLLVGQFKIYPLHVENSSRQTDRQTMFFKRQPAAMFNNAITLKRLENLSNTYIHVHTYIHTYIIRTRSMLGTLK